MSSFKPPLLLRDVSPIDWEQYQSGQSTIERDGNDDVVERWNRIRALGVDPDGVEVAETISNEAELRERWAPIEPVWQATRDIIEAAAQSLGDQHFKLLLADTEGVVMQALGGGGFSREAQRVRLIRGAYWGEPIRGTNAIGTALAEGRPVIVAGCAHFERTNHRLVCYASPIRDAFGDTLAVLDATSFIEHDSPHAQMLLLRTARAAEQALRMHAYTRVSADTLSLLERILEHHPTPAMLVERPGVIRSLNSAGQHALGVSTANIPLGRLGLQWAQLEASLSALQTPLTIEYSRVNGRVHTQHFTVHTEPILDRSQRLLSMLVFLTPHTPAAPRPLSSPRDVRRAPTTRHAAFAPLLGDDPQMLAAIDTASRLAATTLPVLLLAETGTGKELMAKAVHAASDRDDHPLISVNCAAFTPQLLQSELFGYGAHAFTGSRRGGQEGKIAAAQHGTLFLDEIADMSPELQAMLLRVLEDGSYYRVGEHQVRTADIRLICATCRDLTECVERGEFRNDLYYRIRGARITLPPLRERTDLTLLARGLLEQLAHDVGRNTPRLHPDVIQWFLHYGWPGNIRELKMALHYALAIAPGDVIGVHHLPDDITDVSLDPPHTRSPTSAVASVTMAPPQPDLAPTATPDPPPSSSDPLRDAEEEAVRRALAQAGGNISEASRILGVARSTLYRMIRRHNIE